MTENLIAWLKPLAPVLSGQSPPVVDMALTFAITGAAVTGYLALAVSGSGSIKWRWIAAIGWTLWSVRFWWAAIVFDKPVIPFISAVAILGIAISAMLQNLCDAVPACRRAHE